MALKHLNALCYLGPMVKWVAALALAFTFSAAVPAQPIRILPPGGKLGVLGGQRYAFPLVQIGNDVLRLSPGALVYDQNNRTIVHAALPGNAAVLYVQDAVGEVSRMYVLRPEELEGIRRARER